VQTLATFVSIGLAVAMIAAATLMVVRNERVHPVLVLLLAVALLLSRVT
jgi:hypothetical protein